VQLLRVFADAVATIARGVPAVQSFSSIVHGWMSPKIRITV
jgi:hypothetical protein